jgi:hypothetical protein
MIRKPTVAKNIINLDGPDGNAHVLLGLAVIISTFLVCLKSILESILFWKQTMKNCYNVGEAPND